MVYAAAAAKLLQSCPTPCDPIDGSPPGSPVPWILQARTLEWVAISFFYDPALPLLDIFPEKTTILKDTCTLMFIAAIFTIAVTWPLQYSCLENPMDGGAWWAAVHGVAKSRTRLSDFTFTFHFHAFITREAGHQETIFFPGIWRLQCEFHLGYKHHQVSKLPP